MDLLCKAIEKKQFKTIGDIGEFLTKNFTEKQILLSACNFVSDRIKQFNMMKKLQIMMKKEQEKKKQENNSFYS